MSSDQYGRRSDGCGRRMKAPTAMRTIEGRMAKSRVDEVYRRIVGLIAENELGDGDRLPSETVMAARFGASRPVVREALTRLQEGGIVSIRWGAGSYVRDVAGIARSEPTFGPVRSLEEVRHAYILRAALEGDAAALAAEHAPPAAIEAIRRLVDRLETVLATDLTAQDIDIEFHLAVAAAAQNPLFERVLRSMDELTRFSIGLSRTLSLTHPEERRLVVQSEHVAILEAIEARDPERARQAMRLHLANACRRIFQGPGME